MKIKEIIMNLIKDPVFKEPLFWIVLLCLLIGSGYAFFGIFNGWCCPLARFLGGC